MNEFWSSAKPDFGFVLKEPETRDYIHRQRQGKKADVVRARKEFGEQYSTTGSIQISEWNNKQMKTTNIAKAMYFVHVQWSSSVIKPHRYTHILASLK